MTGTFYNNEDIISLQQLNNPYINQINYVPEFINLGRSNAINRPFSRIITEDWNTKFSNALPIVSTDTTEFANIIGEYSTKENKLFSVRYKMRQTGLDYNSNGSADKNIPSILQKMYRMYDEMAYSGMISGKVCTDGIEQVKTDLDLTSAAVNTPSLLYGHIRTQILSMESLLGKGGNYILIVGSDFAKYMSNVYDKEADVYLRMNIKDFASSDGIQLEIRNSLMLASSTNAETEERAIYLIRKDKLDEIRGLAPLLREYKAGGELSDFEWMLGFDSITFNKLQGEPVLKIRYKYAV